MTGFSRVLLTCAIAIGCLALLSVVLMNRKSGNAIVQDVPGGRLIYHVPSEWHVASMGLVSHARQGNENVETFEVQFHWLEAHSPMD
jgi:hypothetical protein